MEIKAGDRFICDLNKAIIEVTSVNTVTKSLTFKDVSNGKTFSYGLEAFKHCYITKSYVAKI